MPEFFGLVTATGHARISNALAMGTSISLTHIAVGDGGGSAIAPTEQMTALVNEVHRAPINTLTQDVDDPHIMWAEIVLPAEIGGWYIREAGVIDNVGNLIAVATVPESYKPALAQGSGSEFVLRLPIVMSNTDAVQLVIDPTVVLASRAYVDDAIDAHATNPDHGLFLRRDTTDVLTAGYYTTPVALDASTGTITPDLTTGNVMTCTLTAPVTLAAPASVPGAGMVVLYLTQNASGGHGLTLDPAYRIQHGSWATDAGAVNVLYLTFDGGSTVDVTISQRGDA